MNDDAKITGITPAIASLSGMCVFCPPYIFLPTTFFAYCTGILLSACCTNTTPPTKSTAPTNIVNAIKMEAAGKGKVVANKKKVGK